MNGQHQHQQQQITGTSLDAQPDCTIACDKGHLTAHKLILCDHSKYLHDILSKYPTAEHPIIILTEVNITDIKILVNYMYTGELVITNDSSPTSLLRAAQILKIDSLTADDDEDGDEDDDLDGPPTGLSGVDVDLDDHHNSIMNQQQQQQQQQQQLQNHDLDDLNDDIDEGNEEQVDHEDIDDNEDNDDDLMMDDDDLDNIASNNNSRLINSIQNIYSLNQFIDNTSPPPQQKQQKHQNNKIRCHLCNIGLSDVKCLYRHVLTRHLPEKWGYKCEFCDREFSRDDHLMRHYTTKHKNMEFNREKIRETRRLNREMAKNFHDQISTLNFNTPKVT